jgi:hypothetical protein
VVELARARYRHMARMDANHEIGTCLAILRAAQIRLDRGLAEVELRAVEQYWGFRFPGDLRELLSRALPRGDHMPNWRDPSSDEIRGRMQWPLDGMLFDVEHDQFWVPGWGPRPAALPDALARATERFREVPKLVPIFMHRYLPAEPYEAGNPVFSVYQMDVIYYGRTLRDYVACQFGVVAWKDAVAGEKRPIVFWSDVADGVFE